MELPWDTTGFRMPMYTIYGPNTKDQPGKYVVRLFDMDQPTAQCARCPDLETARQCIPPYLCRLPRDPNDDPVIVEVWF